MSPKHRTTRNDLFLVRFWLEEDMSSEVDGQSGWGGRVQRAVSGESHEFNDWDALVKVLRAMLAATSPSFKADGAPESGSNPRSESGIRGEDK
jgi:hypothetical protein